MNDSAKSSQKHVCPVWVGYFMLSPVRKLFQNPKKVLSTYVKEEMTVVDVGSAMGFFSLPMASMVGPKGKVLCVDLQEKMLERLEKRASKAGLKERIHTCVATEASLGLEDFGGKVDFALAMAVVHEVLGPERFFGQLYGCLRRKGQLLISEPKGHVSEKRFEETVVLAERAGFQRQERVRIGWSRSILLSRE